MVWSLALYDLNRSRASEVHEAEQIAIFQAQASAENARSTIKRINEIALDMRTHWIDNRAGFADLVQGRKEHTEDIAFQVAVIGADGYLVYSSLSTTTDRIYLGDREHFRVHQQANSRDRLFISKPVKGKVSGRWSIQFTRPILHDNRFAGVLVISVSPNAFAEFSETNEFRPDTSEMVADSGDILAHHPGIGDHLGKRLTDVPFLAPNAPLSGYFMQVAQTDGIERIYGFSRNYEYGISFVVSRTMGSVLAPFHAHRKIVLAITVVISILVVLLIRLNFRSSRIREEMDKQLRDSKAMLWSAVDTIGEAFVIFDSDDRLAYCNEQYRVYYEKSADILVPGSHFEEIIRIAAERGQYPEAIGRVDEWVAERLAARQRGNSEIIQRTDTGRWVRVLERITPEGFTAGFCIDITELYEAKFAAESANQAKSDFVANISHEIRTPMNSMLGMAQILMTPEISEVERLDHARTILRCGQTLFTLLNDILDISKVEAGKVELQPAEFSPVELVSETVQLFAGPAHLKKLLILIDSSLPDGRNYMADPTRLRQMLSNLISNALTFTEEGEIRVEVHQLETAEGCVMLEFAVTDTGIGIDQNDIPRLFKPFSQIDGSATRQYGGTGLGLAIVQNLARLMKGDAGLSSELGRGSRFWFRVRADVLAVPDSRPEVRLGYADSGHASGVVSSQRKRCILVVDDDPIHRKIVVAAMVRKGFLPTSAENGQQAVDAIRSGEEFDLILMDISMPLLNGYEATEQIRQWQTEHNAPRRPIVAITANAFEENRRRCYAIGMDDFMAKPIEFGSLDKLLDKWLSPQNTASTQHVIGPPMVAVDLDALLLIMEEMIPLLMMHKFDAFGRFKLLKVAMTNTDAAAEIDEIEKVLSAMKFEQVIERLHQFAQARGRSLSA